MSSQTEKLHLIKPDGTEAIYIDTINGNYEILDTEVGSRPKTVNNEIPDENGNVQIDSVHFAENLESENAQTNAGEFVIRTTGGEASLSDGDAWALRILGNRTHDGYVAEVINMSVSAMPRDEGEPITATINEGTFRAYVSSSGTTTLTYGTSWNADLSNYGVTVTGTPVAGDVIVIEYVKEERGTITVATPTALKSTGFNLYNHSAGYAYVHKYSDTYGFRISGTYTSLQYSETVTGTKTAIAPVGGNFTVPGDGYVFVTGGNATSTCIVATWSDWTSGYPGGFQPYSETTVNISMLVGQRFPHGLMMVGTTRDEIDLNLQMAYSRIERTTYTAANLATVIASGAEYEYDTDYIYYVKENASAYTISVEGGYTASDHGMEFFTGTAVPAMLETIYGANLKNKLERDVLTISQQTLSKAQQEQVQANIRALSKLRNTLRSTDNLDSLNSVESNGIYYITTGVQNCPFTWGALLSMMADDTGAQIGIGNGVVYYRIRSGTPHEWLPWYAIHGSSKIENANGIGTMIEGTSLTNTVPSDTATNIRQIVLSPGIYMITGGFQFTSDFSALMTGYIAAGSNTVLGTVVRSNVGKGHGYNGSAIVSVATETTYYLCAIQTSGANRTTGSVMFRAARLA